LSVFFGLTRGELILIIATFAVVYGAGFLPRLATLLSRLLATRPPRKSKNALGDRSNEHL